MKSISAALLLMAAALTGVQNTQAQETKKLKAGIMVGTNLEFMDHEYAGIKLQPGIDAGVFAETRFAGNWLANARLQWSLNRIGIGAYQLYSSGPCGTPYKTAYASDYKTMSLKLPLTAGYSFPVSSNASVFVLAGPMLNYVFSAKEEIQTTWWDKGWFDAKFYNDFRVDAMVRVGTELFGHHRIELSYDINLTDIAPRYKRRISVIGLSYGYAF